MRKLFFLIAPLMVACSDPSQEVLDKYYERTMKLVEIGEEAEQIIIEKNHQYEQLLQHDDSLEEELGQVKSQLSVIEKESREYEAPAMAMAIAEPIEEPVLAAPIAMSTDTLVQLVEIDSQVVVYDTVYKEVVVYDTIQIPHFDTTDQKKLRIYQRIQNLIKKL